MLKDGPPSERLQLENVKLNELLFSFRDKDSPTSRAMTTASALTNYAMEDAVAELTEVVHPEGEEVEMGGEKLSIYRGAIEIRAPLRPHQWHKPKTRQTEGPFECGCRAKTVLGLLKQEDNQESRCNRSDCGRSER